MFRLIGIQEIIKNLIRLTQRHLKKDLNKNSLQKAYRSFLREAQPAVPKPDCITPAFLSFPNEIQALLEAFKEDSILDDFEEVFETPDSQFRSEPIEKVKRAYGLMREINPLYADIIDLTIHTIFSTPSKLAGGGSTSAAIGCIWIDSRPHWNDQDILEFLVHETTHNLVFLDELCFTHYSSYPDIAKKENFAWSAILNIPRPLDKVFHSILVSTEVLVFRELYIGHPEKPYLHPPTNILLSQALSSLQYLHENSYLNPLLTTRAHTLLKGCEEILSTIKEQIGGALCEV